MADLLAKRPGGINLLARPASQAPFYPAPTAQAAYVAVWEHDVGEPREAARFVGNFGIKAQIHLPFNPASDRSKVIYVVSYSQGGVPSVNQLAHAPSMIVNFKREASAPTVQLIGAATPSRLTLGIDGFTNYARRRRIRLADNSGMVGASVFSFDSGAQLMPRFVDIQRAPVFQPVFSWSGLDPAANGFTKIGSGTTAANGSGWRINTSGSDQRTRYTRDAFPAAPFANGFTLELQPPTVASTDGGDAVVLRLDDGSKRYDLSFTNTQVSLNGGALRTHGGARVRLVVAVGGAVADLWIGTTKVENDTAFVAGGAAGLSFGDHALAEDSDATWFTLAYALVPQDPQLTQTIYVRVAHDSGNGYGLESPVQSFSFADEFGAGGSTGTADEFFFWRQDVTL